MEERSSSFSLVAREGRGVVALARSADFFFFFSLREKVFALCDVVGLFRQGRMNYSRRLLVILE